MTNWYLMGQSPVYLGGNERENFDAYAQDAFSELLNSKVVTKSLELCTSDLSKIIMVDGIILNNTADTKIKTMERQVLLPIGTNAKAGMYVKYMNRYWLVGGLVDDGGIYEKLVIVLCQYLFKFQDENASIIERYGNILTASQYNKGEASDKTMILESNQLLVTLPVDNYTLEIDTPQRFFISNSKTHHKTYKVTRNDTITYNYEDSGTINLILTQDVLKENDRPDLGLCDYRIPSSSSIPPIHNIMTCKIVGKTNSLKVGGKPKVFTAKFKDSQGNDINDIIPQWNIQCDYNITKTLLNNSIELSITDQSAVGSTLLLQIINADCQAEITIDIEDIY